MRDVSNDFGFFEGGFMDDEFWGGWMDSFVYPLLVLFVSMYDTDDTWMGETQRTKACINRHPIHGLAFLSTSSCSFSYRQGTMEAKKVRN